MNTRTFLEGLLQDARHALRMIRWNPGFSAAALLSLSIGIGANTAIFTVVDAVLIRPLPYPEAESLIGVYNAGVIGSQTFNDMGLGPGMYAALKERSAAFQEFGVWSPGTATVTGIGDPEQVDAVRMTYRRPAGVACSATCRPRLLPRRRYAGHTGDCRPFPCLLDAPVWRRRASARTRCGD